MRSVLLLAWRYICYHRLKTAILAAAVALTLLLPLALTLLIGQYERRLMARAEATPLVLGSRGNRFDLVLQTLYFRPGRTRPIPAGALEELREEGLGRPIPIHARHTAQGHPIIGTTLDYFELRGLRVASGRPPGLLGEAVLGSNAAAALGIGAGDTLRSDRDNVYDLAGGFPLRLRVAGVLAPSDSPDDLAVFVDIRTAWVIEGLGHGHEDLAESADPAYVLEREAGNVAANAALPTYIEITEDNIDSFHFHGDTGRFPLTAAIIVPRDDKARTILKARYRVSETRQLLEPGEVMAELMGIVFRVKRFFDANFAMVAVSTALFLALVVLLSLRLRRRERMTIHKIGGSRGLVFMLQAAELGIVLLISIALAGGLAAALALAAPRLFRLL